MPWYGRRLGAPGSGDRRAYGAPAGSYGHIGRVALSGRGGAQCGVTLVPREACAGVPRGAGHGVLAWLQYPGCAIVSEIASSRGLYAALNRALAVTDGWSWFTALNDDDRLATGFGRYAAQHCTPGTRDVHRAYGDVRLIGERGEALGTARRWNARTATLSPALGVQVSFRSCSQQGTLIEPAGHRRTGRLLAKQYDLWRRPRPLGTRRESWDALSVSSRPRGRAFACDGGQLSESRRTSRSAQETWDIPAPPLAARRAV